MYWEIHTKALSVKYVKESPTAHGTSKTCAAVWLPVWDLYFKKDVN